MLANALEEGAAGSFGFADLANFWFGFSVSALKNYGFSPLLSHAVRGNKNYGESCTNEGIRFLGDPGATSQDDAIFLGESLLQELKFSS